MPTIERLIEFLEDLFDAISEDGLAGAVDFIRERFDGFFDALHENRNAAALMAAIVVALGRSWRLPHWSRSLSLASLH